MLNISLFESHEVALIMVSYLRVMRKLNLCESARVQIRDAGLEVRVWT